MAGSGLSFHTTIHTCLSPTGSLQNNPVPLEVRPNAGGKHIFFSELYG